MNIEGAKDFFFWLVVVNYGLLLLWFGIFVYARDRIYKMHSSWFRLSEERFDEMMYLGMMIYKLLILFFVVMPYIALRIALMT